MFEGFWELFVMFFRGSWEAFGRFWQVFGMCLEGV